VLPDDKSAANRFVLVAAIIIPDVLEHPAPPMLQGRIEKKQAQTYEELMAEQAEAEEVRCGC